MSTPLRQPTPEQRARLDAGFAVINDPNESVESKEAVRSKMAQWAAKNGLSVAIPASEPESKPPDFVSYGGPLKTKRSEPAVGENAGLEFANIDDGELEIDAEKNKRKPLPKKADKYGYLGSAGMGAAQGLLFNSADEIGGATMGAYDALTSDESLGDAYTKRRDALRGKFDQAAIDNPLSYTVGEIGSSFLVPGMGTLGAMSKVAKGGTLLSRMGQAAKVAAPIGAATGVAQGIGAADDLSDVPESAAVGGVAGTLFGAAGGAAGEAAGTGLRKAGKWAADKLRADPDVRTFEKAGGSFRLGLDPLSPSAQMMADDAAARAHPGPFTKSAGDMASEPAVAPLANLLQNADDAISSKARSDKEAFYAAHENNKVSTAPIVDYVHDILSGFKAGEGGEISLSPTQKLKQIAKKMSVVDEASVGDDMADLEVRDATAAFGGDAEDSAVVRFILGYEEALKGGRAPDYSPRELDTLISNLDAVSKWEGTPTAEAELFRQLRSKAAKLRESSYEDLDKIAAQEASDIADIQAARGSLGLNPKDRHLGDVRPGSPQYRALQGAAYGMGGKTVGGGSQDALERIYERFGGGNQEVLDAINRATGQRAHDVLKKKHGKVHGIVSPGGGTMYASNPLPFAMGNVAALENKNALRLDLPSVRLMNPWLEQRQEEQ